jgi:hypothetical protein
MAYELQIDPSVDQATKAGTFALLVFSIGGFISFTVEHKKS